MMYRPNPISRARSAAARCALTASCISTRRKRYSFAFRFSGEYTPRISRSSSSSGKNRDVLQHQARQSEVSMVQTAKILGGSFGHAIDVLWRERNVLGHPNRLCSGVRNHRIAENAGGARENERLHACRNRLLQQIQCAGDVSVDKILRRMRDYVRFMQRGGAKDELHAPHATPDKRPVSDRAGMGGKRRFQDVQAHDVAI